MSYVEAQGRRPTTETLSKTEIACTPVLAPIFGRPVGAPMYRIRRRRSVDGRAVLVETIVVDAAMAPDLFQEGVPAFSRILTGLGIRKDDAQLSAAVQQIINDMRSDGSYARLLSQWQVSSDTLN